MYNEFHHLHAGGCPVSRRKSIVLDHSGVSGVEGGEELGQLCESVEEMILSANDITQWSHVSLREKGSGPVDIFEVVDGERTQSNAHCNY